MSYQNEAQDGCAFLILENPRCQQGFKGATGFAKYCTKGPEQRAAKIVKKAVTPEIVF